MGVSNTNLTSPRGSLLDKRVYLIGASIRKFTVSVDGICYLPLKMQKIDEC